MAKGVIKTLDDYFLGSDIIDFYKAQIKETPDQYEFLKQDRNK